LVGHIERIGSCSGDGMQQRWILGTDERFMQRSAVFHLNRAISIIALFGEALTFSIEL
jgi:hypothetical protein